MENTSVHITAFITLLVVLIVLYSLAFDTKIFITLYSSIVSLCWNLYLFGYHIRGLDYVKKID